MTEPRVDTDSFRVMGSDAHVILVDAPDGSLRLEVFHWGLIPSWAKDRKIGAKSRTQAVLWGVDHGFKPDHHRIDHWRGGP